MAGFVWCGKCHMKDLWGIKLSVGMSVGVVKEGAGEMKCLWRNVSLTCGQTKNRYTRQEYLPQL